MPERAQQRLNHKPLMDDTEIMHSGPDWRWVVGISGALIAILLAAVNTLWAAQMSDIKQRQQSNIEHIQTHGEEIVKLKADTEYIKRGVDDIRAMIKSGM